MKRQFVRIRSPKSRIELSNRARWIESLETRHYCAIDLQLIDVPIKSLLDTAEISYQTEASETGEFLNKPEISEALVEEKEFIEEKESIEGHLREPAPDYSVFPLYDDAVILETSGDTCHNSNGQELGTSADVDDANGCSLPLTQDRFFGDSLTNSPGSESTANPSNSSGSGGLSGNLSAPAVSLISSVANELRPQLQPIEQLSMGRIPIALSGSIQFNSEQQSSAQSFASIPITRALTPLQTSDKSPQDAESHHSIGHELAFSRPMASFLNAINSQVGARRAGSEFRILRPQLARIPLIMPKNLSLLPTMVSETISKTNADAESQRTNTAETPAVRPTIEVMKRSTPETEKVDGQAAVAVPGSLIGKSGQVIFGSLLCGFVMLPRRLRSRLLGRGERR